MLTKLKLCLIYIKIYCKNKYELKIILMFIIRVPWFEYSSLSYIFCFWKELSLYPTYLLPPYTHKLTIKTRPCSAKLHQRNLQWPSLSYLIPDSLLFDLVQSGMLFVFTQCKKTSGVHQNHHDLWHFPTDCHPIYINWMQCIQHTLLITLIYFSS